MNRLFVGFLAVLLLTGCQTVKESGRTAEDTAWELADQIESETPLIVAIAAFEAEDVPESLTSSFRNDLRTNLAIAFREYGDGHKVVTRDRVDAVFAEKGLALGGLTDAESLKSVGGLLGADILATGSIILVEDDIYRVTIQLIETGTGAVIGGVAKDLWFDISGN